MTAYLVPLQANAQTFPISLAGTVYNLTIHWNAPSAAWILDIADAGKNPMVSGIPLVTGTDLLAQYAYLGFGGQLIAQTDNDTSAVPTYANLGQGGNLYFVTSP